MSTDTRTLTPHRALLHPLWLSSLLLLALNDHVLKGAGLLPGVVTGKLSDFAGLLVAPALLAVLVGVRTRRGWWLAHVAVGVVFSAIQLSPDAAAVWGGAMAMLGAPWVIVCDPSDLLALPMLLVGARVFARSMARPASSNLRRSAEWSVAVVGLACCVATSPATSGEVRFPEIFADVYVHNATGEDLVVRVRAVSPSVDYDCDAVARDPGRLLQPAVFGPGRAWSLRSEANMALLEDDSDRECHAALVDADDFMPVVVFWRDGQPPRQWISGTGIEPSAPGWISLTEDGEGRARWESERDLFFPSIASAGPMEASCMAPQDGSRLDWSSMPLGERTLVSVESGVDGCLELTLTADDPMGPEIETHRGYLCVPRAMFPFEPGDRFELLHNVEASSGWVEGLRLRELVEEELPLRELLVSRGGGLPRMPELDAAFTPDFDCPMLAESRCGTATRVGSIVLGGGDVGAVEARAGEAPASIELGGGARIDLLVAHATERTVLDPECALGADSLGPDIEIAVAHHRLDP